MHTLPKPLRALSAAGAFILTTSVSLAQAPALPTPERTDPVKLGLMSGFPPPPDKVVKLSSVLKFPKANGQAVRAGYSYHNQWWHINPAAELVIIKLSSHPVGDTSVTHNVDRRAFAAIAGAVRGR